MDNENRQTNSDGVLKKDSFLNLMEDNRNRILGYILTMVPNWNDAEDLLHDTMAVILKKKDQFNSGKNFMAWACGIARYEILNFRRKHKDEKLLFDEQVLASIDEYLTDKESKIDRIMQIIKYCVEKLGPTDRNLIQMHYSEELSIKDVSLRMGRSLRGLYRSFARIHGVLLLCVESEVNNEFYF